MTESTREHFIENYLVLLQNDLLRKLPESGPTTLLLHQAGKIGNDMGAHMISAIHRRMEDDEKDNKTKGRV